MTMEYVADANVLFGAFISGKDFYRLLFSGHTIYLPDYAFVEIEKYKSRRPRCAESGTTLFSMGSESREATGVAATA